jgi:FHA domain
MWQALVESNKASSLYYLPAGKWLLGRDVKKCDIAVSDTTVSRSHLFIGTDVLNLRYYLLAIHKSQTRAGLIQSRGPYP